MKNIKTTKVITEVAMILFLQGKSFFGEVVPYTVMSLLMALSIFWAHRENIKRLRSGTEPSFGSRKK